MQFSFDLVTTCYYCYFPGTSPTNQNLSCWDQDDLWPMRSSVAGTTELLSLALTLNLPSCHVFLSALLYYSLFKEIDKCLRIFFDRTLVVGQSLRTGISGYPWREMDNCWIVMDTYMRRRSSVSGLLHERGGGQRLLPRCCELLLVFLYYAAKIPCHSWRRMENK